MASNPETTLRALIARIEAAKEAGRELDDEIAMAIGVPASVKLGDEMLGYVRWAPVKSKLYTASIDAAVSLVPAGWKWEVYSDGAALLWRQPPGAHEIRRTATALGCATPALALTAAALRAHGGSRLEMTGLHRRLEHHEPGIEVTPWIHLDGQGVLPAKAPFIHRLRIRHGHQCLIRR